jgi:hypothetical protein
MIFGITLGCWRRGRELGEEVVVVMCVCVCRLVVWLPTAVCCYYYYYLPLDAWSVL